MLKGENFKMNNNHLGTPRKKINQILLCKWFSFSAKRGYSFRKIYISSAQLPERRRGENIIKVKLT